MLSVVSKTSLSVARLAVTLAKTLLVVLVSILQLSALLAVVKLWFHLSQSLTVLCIAVSVLLKCVIMTQRFDSLLLFF